MIATSTTSPSVSSTNKKWNVVVTANWVRASTSGSAMSPYVAELHVGRQPFGAVDCLLMKPDALRGHLDALLLATLDGDRLHGYAIIEALQQRSGGALDLPTGTVYPALRRLERGGLVASEWTTVGGRQRRTYRLNKAGQRALADERTAWREFTTA